MSSHLRHLVVDLINDVKSTSDAQSKLYLLEQVREICLHRDKAALKDSVADMADFVLEKPMSIRRFIVRFFNEAMIQDPDCVLPHYLTVLQYYINESNDALLTLLAKSFNSYYESVLLKIVHMVPAATKSPSGLDPPQLWQTFCGLVARFHDFVSSSRSEQLRTNCLKICESVMIFGLPNQQLTATSDPRLARKDPRLNRGAASKPAESVAAAAGPSSSSSTAQTVEEISLHHPFVNKTEIQRVAEDYFTKVLLWSGKGGPQGYPFTPNLMSSLGQLIANVSSARLKYGPTGAKALVFMIQGKGSVADLMTGADREGLARAVHRLIRAITASSTADPEGTVPKLRSSVSTLEAMGLDVSGATHQLQNNNNSNLSGLKRGSDALEPGATHASAQEDDEDEGVLSERKSAAVAAIDEAERKLKSARGQADQEAGAAGGGAVGCSTGTELSVGACTELSKELPSLASTATAAAVRVKLVSTVQSSASMMPLSLFAATHSSNVSISQRPAPPSAESYSALALIALKNMLDSYCNADLGTEKMQSSLSLLFVKTVLSMTLTDICSSDPSEQAVVPIIATLSSSTAAPRLSESVPTIVRLPRCIWLFLGYILTLKPTTLVDANAAMTAMDDSIDAMEDIRHRVGVLVKFCVALHREVQWQRAQHGGDADLETEETARICADLMTAYEATCLTVMSRLLQIIRWRPVLRDFMHALPMVPAACLQALQLLIFTGSQGGGMLSAYDVRDKGDSSRSKGTRLVALLTMGQLVFATDEAAAYTALCCLLWCCLSEDFELRTRVISLLANDLMQIQVKCDELVIKFGLHAMVAVIGAEGMAAWFEHQKTRPVAVDRVGVSEGGIDDEEEEDAFRCPTLLEAHETFDGGLSFRGEFFPVDTLPLSLSDRESYAKRALQLLSQICMSNIQLLACFVDIFIAAQCSDSITTAAVDAATVTAAGPSEPIMEVDGAAETKDDASVSTTRWSLRDAIKSELSNIVPAMCHHSSVESILSVMMTNIDPACKPLLCHVLRVLYSDYSTPVPANVINKVKDYIRRCEEESLHANSGPTDLLDAVGSTSLALPAMGMRDPEHLRLLLPLVGGFSAAEMQDSLPRVISLCSDDSDELKGVLIRITKARPPVMTKASLLVCLHRIDFELHGLKAKVVLDTISLCLNNKAEYTAEVVKDALKTMLAEAVPPYAMMRTAILSGQSFGEVKKFVLSDVIPSLVRRSIWVESPKLWDGVCVATKNFAVGGVNAEATLRALLGIPAAQLRALLRVAPNVKAVMAKVLKALAPEERDEVVSGRRVGVSAVGAGGAMMETGEATSTTTAGAADVAKSEADKLRLVKDIMATPIV